MPSLRIPDSYRAGVASMIGLTDDATAELLTALGDVSPGLVRGNVKQLVAHLVARVRSIPESELRSIINTLISLYVVRAQREATITDFARDVCQAVEQSGDPQLELSVENREAFEQRLVQLLGFDSFNIGSKAIDISQEYQHVLCSLRILTDIRPVFGDEIELLPKGGVVTHTLKIVYHRGSERKEFFVVLDTKQMEALGSALDRAKAKAASVKSVLDHMGIQYLDKEHLE